MENAQDASEVDVHVTSPLIQNIDIEDVVADDHDLNVVPSSIISDAVISNSNDEENEVPPLSIVENGQDEKLHLDVSSTQNDPTTITHIQALTTTTWQQLNKTMRSELLHEGKSDTWRDEWFGVHLPPSAVVIGSPTLEIVEESTIVQEKLVLDSEEEEEVNEEDDDLITEELIEEEQVEIEQVEIPAQIMEEPPVPAVTTTTTPQEVPQDNVPLPTPQPMTLYTLLTSPGPSIPLYPLLLLLLTLYTIKQVLNCIFGFKSRTRVSRSVNRVLWKQKQFVIPKDQLLQHIEWMRLRNDLRRMKEKNSRMMEEVKGGSGGSLDEDEDGGRRNGGSGMNGNSRGSGNGGSVGRYQGDSTDDNEDNEQNDNYDGNDNSQNYSNHNSYLDIDDDKENIYPALDRKVLFSMEEDEQSISDVVCNLEKTALQSVRFEDLLEKDEHVNSNTDTTDEETSQESIPNFPEEVPTGDLEQLKAKNISAAEKILILKKMIAELVEKKDGEIALLQSQVKLSEQAAKESSEKVAAYEKKCNDMKEEIASLKEDVAVLELVCERMYSSGEGEDDLEGLEIEGANCLRSQLGSLTNFDENEDEMSASTDTEWDRMVDENQLLRSENELLQESLTCLRKELEEARSEAESLSQEMKNVKILKVSSPIRNDETMEMTDESFECAGNNNSIPLFVDGTIPKVEAPQSQPPRSREVTNAIQLIIKAAQSAKEVPKENENPNHDLNKDLLQLMANLRRLDIDQRTEGERPSTPRKKRSTKGRESPGKGSSRRRSAKERLKILAKSRFRRFKSLKSS